jgi:uncharacterized SAM-binding protein YcdF (DUF218 family)
LSEPAAPAALRAGNGRRLLAAATAACVAAVLVSLAVPPVRAALLRAAGASLVARDDLAPSDAIVLATAAGAAGVLEAADLVHAGVAPRVAVFADPPDAADQEFRRRGVPYEDEAARYRRELHALGVAEVGQIPRPVSGTEDEGQVLPGWCDERGWCSIVVVTTSDHSRRLRRVLRRALAGHPTRVIVRPSRYSRFDPTAWWRSRDQTRTEIVELQKLLLDLVRHPLS